MTNFLGGSPYNQLWFMLLNSKNDQHFCQPSYSLITLILRQKEPSLCLKIKLAQDAHYDNPEQARMDIFKYIQLYYNEERETNL